MLQEGTPQNSILTPDEKTSSKQLSRRDFLRVLTGLTKGATALSAVSTLPRSSEGPTLQPQNVFTLNKEITVYGDNGETKIHADILVNLVELLKYSNLPQGIEMIRVNGAHDLQDRFSIDETYAIAIDIQKLTESINQFVASMRVSLPSNITLSIDPNNPVVIDHPGRSQSKFLYKVAEPNQLENSTDFEGDVTAQQWVREHISGGKVVYAWNGGGIGNKYLKPAFEYVKNPDFRNATSIKHLFDKGAPSLALRYARTNTPDS